MTHVAIASYLKRIGILTISAATFTVAVQAQHYAQTNLVSNQPGVAPITDPNLVNPWGLSRSSTGDWWVANNGSGTSTLYDGTGKITPLVVKIPASDPTSTAGGVATGTIFNGGTGFEVASGKPSIFLFVTEDGTISGWSPAVAPTKAIIKVNEKDKSVFKGATAATINLPYFGTQTLLYVADFRQGRVQIYDSLFQHIPDLGLLFRDPQLPAGYAPFNVQNIGGNIYVTYAMQDSAKHDEVDGAGMGYVDIFTPTGILLKRLQHGAWLNAPWGLALAPGDFGQYSHDLLVGQFGSGEIAVFDPLTGNYLGVLNDAKDKPIRIGGLWGLTFGNGTGAGPALSLYFAAGSHHEQDGLFGSIAAIENPQGNDQ